MENNATPSSRFKDLVHWATTPPQAYVVYVLLLFLVFGMSFLAGALRPKTPTGTAPPVTQQKS